MLITNPVVMISLISAEAFCPLPVKWGRSWRVDTVELEEEQGISCLREAFLSPCLYNYSLLLFTTPPSGLFLTFIWVNLRPQCVRCCHSGYSNTAYLTCLQYFHSKQTQVCEMLQSVCPSRSRWVHGDTHVWGERWCCAGLPGWMEISPSLSSVCAHLCSYANAVPESTGIHSWWHPARRGRRVK